MGRKAVARGACRDGAYFVWVPFGGDAKPKNAHGPQSVKWLRANRPITISLGVGVYPQHSALSDLILCSADNALYEAKEQGRNRVMLAKPLVEKT